MNSPQRHTSFSWLIWMALLICIAVSADVVEDLLIEEVPIPVTSGTLPDSEVENAIEDLLIPSARFVSHADYAQVQLLPSADTDASSPWGNFFQLSGVQGRLLK
jgi:hypothetical protein